MRIGIYGGSFNPVHNGHIHLAENAADILNLDRVYLVPSRISPHRSSDEYASGEDRMEMLRLACEGNERLFPCDFELKNDRKSYSYYTVEEFRRNFPDDELFLLMGSDMLLCFDSWYRFEDIMKEVTLAVVSRNDGDFELLEEKAENLRKFGKIIVCPTEPLEMSSSEIRKKIAENEKIPCYLHENVVQYITSRKLYRGDTFVI